MDTEEKFFETRIDRTPYPAFGWIAAAVIATFVIGGYSIWHIGSYLKAQNWLSANNVSGAADAALSGSDSLLNSGSNALDQAAKQAADAAKAQATQDLLNQKDAAIKSVTDSAKQAIASAAPSAAASAATSGQEAFQQYLGQ